MPSPLISLHNVSHHFGPKTVLSHVDLTVDEGDFVAITGPNGGGKTTLLRILLRLLKPSEGTVTTHRRGLTLGYLPQKNAIDSHFPITVREVVTMGLNMGLTRRITAQERARVDDTLQLVGLHEVQGQAIGQLSGGQLQRALLARAIIGEPQLLVLDEPLSYIDKHFEQRLYDIIGAVAQHATVVLVSHEMSTIARMVTRHLIVEQHLHECTAAHHGVVTACD